MANSTMRAIKMPSEDQDQVIKYMQYIHETPDVEQDSDKFFEMLSSTLRREVLFKIHKATLDKITILRECSSIEKSFIVSHLVTQLFMEGDQIIRQGEEGDCLYFINKGEVEVKLQIYQYENKANELVSDGNDGKSEVDKLS